MRQQRCLLCGQEYPAGLHVMGCLICFPCEKRLLSATVEELPPRGQRLRLMSLYHQGGALEPCSRARRVRAGGAATAGDC
ncbi:MAG: sigma factor G inhibitor Gin [Clostridia bacterium]